MPRPGPRSGDAYLRFIPRTETDIAVVGVGISLTLEKGFITCVALGAVAPTPLLHAVARRGRSLGPRLDDAVFRKIV